MTLKDLYQANIHATRGAWQTAAAIIATDDESTYKPEEKELRDRLIQEAVDPIIAGFSSELKRRKGQAQ